MRSANPTPHPMQPVLGPRFLPTLSKGVCLPTALALPTGPGGQGEGQESDSNRLEGLLATSRAADPQRMPASSSTGTADHCPRPPYHP